MTSDEFLAFIREHAYVQERDTISQAYTILNNAVSRVAARATAAFEIGDWVEFEGRKNIPLQGRVEKINQKTLTVNAGGARWRAYASTCKKIDPPAHASVVVPRSSSPRLDPKLARQIEICHEIARLHSGMVIGDGADSSKRWEQEEKLETELQAIADSYGPGLRAGRIYQEQIADGYARYLIVAVAHNVVVLQHIAAGDAWTIPSVESRHGRITLIEATDNIERQDRMSAIFAR